MPSKIRANLELGTQIVIAIAIVVVAGVLVKRQLFSASRPTNAPRINAGEKINAPNVDWAQNQKSLVFFLQKGCVYCTQAAPFYRQIIADATNRKVVSLAILPNPEEEARQYLQSLDLPIQNVRIGPLDSYKIHGTPTMLFVNRDGIVTNVWFGAAAPGAEPEIRAQLTKLFDAGN